MIEKDFWVCLTLKHLFGLPGARDHFIFKGGTSLSKVWRAIHRFSEDIDISLSREWLGFGGDRDSEAVGTRKQRKKQLEALSSACGDRLRSEVAPALRSALTGVLGAEGWSLEIDPQDEQTLLFAYPTVFGEMTGRAYIRPVVKIECGARSDRWPVSSGHVTAYVAEAFPDTLAMTGVDIPVLDIERTFWEKASILHAEAHRPAEKPIPERYSRHYADLAALAKSESAARALERDDLRARVVAHKLVFFPAVWAHTETAVPGTFRLVPPAERLDALARDYSAMRDMFFREPPPWSEVLAVLSELEARINRGGRTA
jgi:hypothetical protein